MRPQATEPDGPPKRGARRFDGFLWNAMTLRLARRDRSFRMSRMPTPCEEADRSEIVWLDLYSKTLYHGHTVIGRHNVVMRNGSA